MHVCKHCLVPIEKADREDIEVWLDASGQATCKYGDAFHRPIGD